MTGPTATPGTPETTAQPLYLRLMPAMFVPLWSTGFIGAKYGLPYVEPLTFLTLRYVLVIALVLLAMAILRPQRIDRQTAFYSVIIGILIHACYLGAVFWSISVGMPAGIAAVIVGLQPILTALLAGVLLNERVSLRQWAGLLLGLLGVIGVLSPGLQAIFGDADNHSGISLITVLTCGGGLVAITLGTILQRAKAQNVPLWPGALYQYIGAFVVTIPLALIFETNQVIWSGELIFALSWLVLVLSIGAISLLVIMLRHGAASRVATLFYLVPPVAALIAWLMFDEQLTVIQLVGMVIASTGVWLATRRPRVRPPVTQ